MATNTNNHIYEISINTTEFSTKFNDKLNNLSYNTISITNKKPETPILEIINKIQQNKPKLQIIPYYSLKYHQKSDLDQTTQEFFHHLVDFQKLNIPETLIISGVPKPKYDSLSILQNLKVLYKSQELPRIAIAYNPFLKAGELETENTRLFNKLQTGIVSSVYFQIGIDINIIQKAVLELRKIQPNIKIYLSLINPTSSRLAQLRYRPWKGVYLATEYLSSTETANTINQSIYDLANTMQLGIIQGE
jgi:hypothetical protein